MPAATIIFSDIVGFSKKSTAEQRRLVEALTSVVLQDTRPLLLPPLENPTLVALPTGDGLALAFLHSAGKPWDRATLLNLIIKMHRWAAEQTTTINQVSLRVGVHVGAIELVTDINGKVNVCGDTINYAQRVMDAANPRQTLFSDAAFREYIGAENVDVEIRYPEEFLSVAFRGPIEVYAKHGLQISVYHLVSSSEVDYISDAEPVSKHLMLVTLTPLPKEVAGSFGDMLQEAKQIAFIQVTGDRVLAKLEAGELQLSSQLKRFWVFMPYPETYENLNVTKYHASPGFISECVTQWVKFLTDLKKKQPDGDFKLGLFREPPYCGASFIDWDRPGGFVHVSPYVWNVPTNKCPGYDMRWIGNKPSEIYETYVGGLQYLNYMTKNLLEAAETPR